ncbi:MAG: ATP-dependent DNA helicase RecG [Pirellulaceae bacterium]|nr:ATP-dependent DNA helicase RecG [Pirellulaceae bacterium]HJN07291.1 ATP-dependent DNA helicase RecG [Pirellulaceae bacterium]
MSTTGGRSSDEQTPGQRLGTPLEFLPGVGPARGKMLQRLDLRFTRDVLFFFPRDYQDMSVLRRIESLEDNRPASICGIVDEIDLRNTGVGRTMLGVLIRQKTQHLRAVWFNQPYMRDKFKLGARVLLSGTPKAKGMRWEMSHPRVEILADDEPPAGKILPVYPLTDGINQGLMRRIVHNTVAEYLDCVEEVFPTEFLELHQLPGIHETLDQIHQPVQRQRLEQAQHRLIYQELLIMQLALAQRRASHRNARCAPRLEATAKIDARIKRLFPFELTAAQLSAIEEIRADMVREYPMNRLLQGDVGSGKTVVAEYAMLLAVAHGKQATIMAPTEVLARQHARTLNDNLRESRVRIALLTGTLKAAERQTTMVAIAEGKVDLVVGTHAVLQESVNFKDLGLVVIDEQHKFGVKQRLSLRQAGLQPHYLVMTATPIPRTVTMAVYGDLDVSTLDETPPGRQNVHTYLSDDEGREKWWDFFRKKLREGRQGYIITPLVDESSTQELASVAEAFEQLANGHLEAFRLDFVHGRQSAEEKESAMNAFRNGETQVLVATSVVEVGVDVPNATLMTIENGERFGLAQLHQLRGRISRGVHPGYLCVFARPASDDSRQRLDAFCQTTDGFELAELDFQMRGPGDLFGAQQHGLPPLRIADLSRDAKVLELARHDASAMIKRDPELVAPEYARLQRMVRVRYGEALDLGDVG